MFPTVRILRACTNCSRPWVLRVFAHECMCVCVNRFDENTTSIQIEKARVLNKHLYTKYLMYIIKRQP